MFFPLKDGGHINLRQSNYQSLWASRSILEKEQVGLDTIHFAGKWIISGFWVIFQWTLQATIVVNMSFPDQLWKTFWGIIEPFSSSGSFVVYGRWCGCLTWFDEGLWLPLLLFVLHCRGFTNTCHVVLSLRLVVWEAVQWSTCRFRGQWRWLLQKRCGEVWGTFGPAGGFCGSPSRILILPVIVFFNT